MAEVQLIVNGVNPSDEPARQTGVAAAATDQYFIPADSNIVLRIYDGNAAASMTVVTPLTVDGLAVADRVIAIPQTVARIVGKFNPRVYGENGRIQFTFAAADATLKVEAIRLT